MTRYKIVVGLGIGACVLSGYRSAGGRSPAKAQARLATWSLGAMQSPAPQESFATQEVDSVRHLWKGSAPGFPYAFRAVVKDSAAFHALWRQAVGREPQLPQVDFGRDMVIVAAMGEQPGTGREIGIDSIRQAGLQTLTVFNHLASGGPYCGGEGAMITYPADMVVVPRDHRTVMFHDIRVQPSCKPFTRNKTKS